MTLQPTLRTTGSLCTHVARKRKSWENSKIPHRRLRRKIHLAPRETNFAEWTFNAQGCLKRHTPKLLTILSLIFSRLLCAHNRILFLSLFKYFKKINLVSLSITYVHSCQYFCHHYLQREHVPQTLELRKTVRIVQARKVARHSKNMHLNAAAILLPHPS